MLGADDLRKALDLDGQTGAYCGYGPAVRLDGVPADTQVKATVRDLLQRRPVTFTTCGKDSAVAVQAGRHNIDVLAGGGFVPVETTLTKAGFGNVSKTPVQAVEVWRPNPAELTVEVPAAEEQSVLTVAQNYNEGWEAYDGSGRKLTPIRIGGWQQGWVLPEGTEQVVTARFMPDRTYRAGLLVGLLALLAVIAMAVFFRRRSRHSGHRLREGRYIGPWVAVGTRPRRRRVHVRLDRLGRRGDRGSVHVVPVRPLVIAVAAGVVAGGDADRGCSALAGRGSGADFRSRPGVDLVRLCTRAVVPADR